MRLVLKWRTLLCALLCVCLLMGTVSGFAAPGDTVLFSGATDAAAMVTTAAAVGDTLYLLTDKLMAYKIGDSEPVAVADLPFVRQPGSFPVLIAHQDALWVLDAMTGTLYCWDGAAFAQTLQLDWTDMGDMTGSVLAWPVWEKDAPLYLLSASAGSNAYQLLRFDTATGACGRVSVNDLMQLAPYAPGKLLAFIWKVVDANNLTGGKMVVLDAETGEVLQELGTMTGLYDGGIAYDTATATAYVISDSKLMAGQAGAPLAPVANTTASMPLVAFGSCLLPGGYYVLVGQTGVTINNTDPQYMQAGGLHIKGFGMDDTLRQKFAQTYPDIPVIVSETIQTSMSQMLEDFMPGTQNDLLMMYTSQGLRPLKEKGYLADLSDIPGVAEAVSRMYPSIREAITQDGKIIALPMEMLVTSWSVNEKLLQETGVEMPTTQQAYFELLAHWENDLAETYPDYALSGSTLAGVLHISNALLSYALTYEKPDAPLQMDTPVFRAVLEAIEQLPYEPVDLEAIMNGSAQMPAADTRTPIINPNDADVFNQYGPKNEDGTPQKRIIPPLPFVPGEPVQTMAMLSVLVMPEATQNRAQAEQFIAFALQEMSAEHRILFYPDENQPLRPADYEQNMETLRTKIQELTTGLADAKAEDKRAMEEELAAATDQLARSEEGLWMISPQAIADYRTVAANMNLMLHSSMAGLDNQTGVEELNDILLRYIKGALSLDEALRDLDNRLNAMYYEGE